MKKEQIHLTDWQRILFGDAPPEFMLEVLIRTIIMYLVFLVVLRLLGKRMSGELTITEVAVMLTLGAIISLPMQSADRGILQGVIILLVALLFQRGLNLWAIKKPKAEEVIYGKEALLVKDGVLNLEEMERSRISRQQLFAEIRGKNIYNLGKVRRLYIEACGLFSFYTHEDQKAGLSVLPPRDENVNNITNQYDENNRACCSCGKVVSAGDAGRPCPVCGKTEFTKAVII